MKRILFFSILFLYVASFNNIIGAEFISDITLSDSTKTQLKEAVKEKKKQELKESGERLFLKSTFIYATLNTSITFDLVNSIFSATVSLENDFKLPATRLFFTGTFIYRFTPSSGIYASYYGINRKTTFTTAKEFIFLGETIPAGINGNAYFNTRVLSVGYLLTILQKKHVFFAAYFNAYLLNYSTGFKAENVNINENIAVTFPLPNFGLLARFPINNWLSITANVGYFGISFKEFGGNINSFDLSVEFRPIHWLGISLSYDSFDLNLYSVQNKIDYIVDYNFKGPAIGLAIIF
jgi:hypothetical protein